MAMMEIDRHTNTHCAKKPLRQRQTLAVSMQSEVTLTLTLTLSPRRGNLQWVRREKSLNGEHSPALEKVLPLPAGEGRGEGECDSQLNSYGLERVRKSRVAVAADVRRRIFADEALELSASLRRRLLFRNTLLSFKL